MTADDSVLELDIGNVLREQVGQKHGIGREELDRLRGRLESCRRDIEQRRGRDIGFMELPYDGALGAEISTRADELRDWCRNFAVVGIGGSALGNIAVHTALNHTFHNLLPPAHPGRRGAPRIFVLDNVDPALVSDFFDVIEPDLEATTFNVITKSGSTAETMSQFLHVRNFLRHRGADPARQIIATTDADPDKSLLRRIVREEGFYALPIPANVGGRFSVLSAVGLLSAAVAGIDIDALLGGAAAMDERCRGEDLHENPAALYAAVLYLLYQRGKPITVLMPYCHALRSLGDWYCQLWAESLGKRHGLGRKDVFVGPTPVASVGVTDQHSVMQLYQDGRFDKVITLIEVEDLSPARTLPICEGDSEQELTYLAGHAFGELFQSELKATRCALSDKQRPNMTVRIPRLDEATLGELFMFFEYAVTYSGWLYGVNPFDQPGVELGKQYTYGLMGREGYASPQV